MWKVFSKRGSGVQDKERATTLRPGAPLAEAEIDPLGEKVNAPGRRFVGQERLS